MSRHDRVEQTRLAASVAPISDISALVVVVLVVVLWLPACNPEYPPSGIALTRTPATLSSVDTPISSPPVTPTLPPAETLLPTSTPTPTTVAPQPTLRWTDIGQSVEGRDLAEAIVGYEMGSAIVVVGSIQGDQPNTRDLINYLIDDFEHELDRIPPNVAFHFIPTINPDGNAAGTRRNANNVDVNRNWPTSDWTPNPQQPGGIVEGAGGSRPLSESETKALQKYLFELQGQNPNLRVVIWHSSSRLSTGGQVYPGYSVNGTDADLRSIARRYAQVTGYALEEEWAYYETSGELITWCVENGIEAVDIVIPRSLLGFDSNLREITLEALLEIAQFP
jgi:hypothetical protein